MKSTSKNISAFLLATFGVAKTMHALLNTEGKLLIGTNNGLYVADINHQRLSDIGDSSITIDDMASAVAVSRSGLHRKVKHLVGTSPMEFLREARIRKAIQMLTESSKPVSEIAYLCGFSDPKYFSKCFKASTGQTPTEYKNAL